MADSNKANSFMQKVNGIDFYCELRGGGPTIVLIPAGEGDCGSFAKVADTLADEFTVFTCDMRGCSRTGSPKEWTPVTHEILASDIYELIKAINLAPATVYGCSSGGQAALSLGVYYPEVARNIMIHEAAVINETAVPGAGLQIMKGMANQFEQLTGSKNAAMSAMLPLLVGDEEAWKALGPEYHERINKNGEVWITHYIGSVDMRVYTAEELTKMPPLVFSVGMNTLAWLVEANRRTAERANAELVWLPCMHYPQVTIPDLLAKHIREYSKKYL